MIHQKIFRSTQLAEADPSMRFTVPGMQMDAPTWLAMTKPEVVQTEKPDILKGILTVEEMAFVYNGLREYVGGSAHSMHEMFLDQNEQMWDKRGDRVMTDTEYFEWRSGHCAEVILLKLGHASVHELQPTEPEEELRQVA